jgi:hypothetical protein
MIFSAGGVDFEIPDEWWAAAGMEAFATARTGYRRHPPTNADLINVILSVREIGVAPRGDCVPDFERDRMVSVFDAFSRELALPPIEVVDVSRRVTDTGSIMAATGWPHRLPWASRLYPP